MMSDVAGKQSILFSHAVSMWTWWKHEMALVLEDVLALRKTGTVEAEITDDGSLVRQDGNDSTTGKVNLNLHISGKHIVYRKISLPAAVLSNIDNVIRYEFDKYFPFNIDDVLTGYETASSSEAGHIDVSVWVVRKNMVTEVIEHLQAEGLSIRKTDIYDTSGKKVITRDRTRAQSRSQSVTNGSRNRLYAVAVLLLLIPVIPVFKINAEIAALEEKLAGLETTAKDVLEVRKKMADMDALLLSVQQDSSRDFDVTETWSSLTTLLGTNADVTRFRISKGKVNLEGSAVSVEQVVKTLEAHEKFSKVSIDAPVRSVNNGARESMKISFRVSAK